MKNKIQYSIQIITREIDDLGYPYDYSTRLSQVASINEDLSFEEQIKASQILVEQVMRNLRNEHEKN